MIKTHPPVTPPSLYSIQQKQSKCASQNLWHWQWLWNVSGLSLITPLCVLLKIHSQTAPPPCQNTLEMTTVCWLVVSRKWELTSGQPLLKNNNKSQTGYKQDGPNKRNTSENTDVQKSLVWKHPTPFHLWPTAVCCSQTPSLHHKRLIKKRRFHGL